MNTQYNSALDELVFTAGEIKLNHFSHLAVQVRSYDDGPLKVAIQKIGTKEDGRPWVTTNLGRLNDDVSCQLADLLIEAAEFIAAEEEEDEIEERQYAKTG